MKGRRHSDRFSNCVGSRARPTSIARLIFNAPVSSWDWSAVFVKDGATRPRVDRIGKRRRAGRAFSRDKGPNRWLEGYFCGDARTGCRPSDWDAMPFAARALKEEAMKYRSLSRYVTDARTLDVLDAMAADLEAKAAAIEGLAAGQTKGETGKA